MHTAVVDEMIYLCNKLSRCLTVFGVNLSLYLHAVPNRCQVKNEVEPVGLFSGTERCWFLKQNFYLAVEVIPTATGRRQICLNTV